MNLKILAPVNKDEAFRKIYDKYGSIFNKKILENIFNDVLASLKFDVNIDYDKIQNQTIRALLHILMESDEVKSIIQEQDYEEHVNQIVNEESNEQVNTDTSNIEDIENEVGYLNEDDFVYNTEYNIPLVPRSRFRSFISDMQNAIFEKRRDEFVNSAYYGFFDFIDVKNAKALYPHLDLNSIDNDTAHPEYLYELALYYMGPITIRDSKNIYYNTCRLKDGTRVPFVSDQMLTHFPGILCNNINKNIKIRTEEMLEESPNITIETVDSFISSFKAAIKTIINT